MRLNIGVVCEPATMQANEGERKPGQVSRLLGQWKQGDSDAFRRLIPIVEREMRKIAKGLMRGENRTMMETRVLVDEAYLRLSRWKNYGAIRENRKAFYALAAQVMRNTLTDYGRKRNRLPARGSLPQPAEPLSLEWVLALDEALERLKHIDKRQHDLVELRYFSDMSMSQVAETMGLPKRTVENLWSAARESLRKLLI